MDNLTDNAPTEQEVQDDLQETESTPEPAVEAVEADPKDDGEDAQTDMDDQDMESLMSMYEESFKQFEEGQVVTGKIISIDKDHVLVDIGYKSEGQIRIHEFMDEEGNLSAKLDDSVEVMVEYWDDENEVVNLSKEKAEKVKVWDAIKEAYENDATFEGVIHSRVKGGFSVDVGVQAFLPGSQADLRPIRNLDDLVGQTFEFKILKFNRKRSNIVLSRRVLLEADRDAKRSTTLATIHEGKEIEGIVKNITEYGVFVDLGGLDGLLHITDISWGRVKHPSDLYKVGDEIIVKVLTLDLEKERVSLGVKQLTPDPWTAAVEKFPVGSRLTGRVVSLTDYGAFVELEQGVEGLIHVSEMSWTRKVRHPSKVVSVDEIVEFVVLDLKPEARRISLGMKQVAPNPWDVISEKYPIGTIIEGKIKNITDFGLFIGIDEGIDGLVHISDISWIKRIKHPTEVYQKGDMVQAKVLDIDKGNERFSLGIKQLEPDPWTTVAQRYQAGKEITGTITNVTDFGVFIELEEGIEGLVHVSEISTEKVKTPVGMYNVGDEISARVMSINSDERRIGLSIKRLDMGEQEAVFADYLNDDKPASSTFGEILRVNLKEKLSASNGKSTASSEPEVEEADPATDKVEPVAEEADSTVDEVEPVAEEVDSAADEVEPVAEEADSATDEVEPVAEEVDLAVDEVEPVAEEVDSTVDEVEPVAEEADSTVDEVEPVAEEVDSAADEVEPVAEEADSTVDEVEPVAEEADSAVDEVEPEAKEAESTEEPIDSAPEAVSDSNDEA